MKAIDAFSPLGVVDLTSDGVEVEPSFEPALDTEGDLGGAAAEEIPSPSEEEIRRQVEQAELAESARDFYKGQCSPGEYADGYVCLQFAVQPFRAVTRGKTPVNSYA